MQVEIPAQEQLAVAAEPQAQAQQAVPSAG
jgi:hypothetical protein